MRPRFIRHLVVSSMNLRLWNEAEEALTTSDDPEVKSADMRVLLAMCRYYKGDLASAEQILATTPDSGAAVHLRHYFHGRVAERKGDLRSALISYERALRREP